MSPWKFFLAKSTEPAWLAYVRVGTSPSKAGSVEKIEAVDLAKNNFQELILPQELVVKSTSKSEKLWNIHVSKQWIHCIWAFDYI